MNNPIKVLSTQSAARRVSRRSVLGTLAAVGIGVVVAGCNRSAVAPNTPVDGQIEDKLNIYSWGDYDDPDVISAFGDDFDVIVQVDAYGSNEEMIAKLAASRGTSGYDIVVPTGLMIPQMIEHKLIQKLDTSRIPNVNTLEKSLQGQYFDPHNEYSVIKDWGTTGYVYNTKAIRTDMKSWQDFLTVAKNKASGKVSLLEDPWEVCQIALGAKGYDLNTDNPHELEECRSIIVNDLAPHVKAYYGNAATAMAQGSFDLMQAWNGDARQGLLDADDPDQWRFVYPTPSANLWIDNWCIATGAQHPDAAHDFINYIIAPEQAIKEVDYIGYPTGSHALLEPSVQEGFDFPELIFPDQSILDRLTASKVTGAQQTLVDIFTQAQARSGV